MKHDCVSCGKPGGNPSQGGLCFSCQVFGKTRTVGYSALRSALRLMRQPK